MFCSAIFARRSAKCAVAAFIALASSASAQRKPSIPLLELRAPEAVSAELFWKIANVLQLSDGTVLVNDMAYRKIIALNPALGNPIMVLDTFSTKAGYGRAPASMIRYPGDSIIVVSSESITLLDPSGRIADWKSAKTNVAMTVQRNPAVGVDPNGMFVFQARVGSRQPASGETASSSAMSASGSVSSGAPAQGLPPNSGLVMRADFATRAVKRVATIRAEPSGQFFMDRDSTGRMLARSVIQPLAVSDDFTMLSDGTVVILRAADYHIDFVRMDGKIDSIPPLPFAWKNLSDNDRKEIIDSTRRAQIAAEASGIKTMERQGAGVMIGVNVANGSGINTRKPGEGFTVDVVRADSLSAGVVAARPNQSPPPGGISALPFGMKAADLEYVPFTDLPKRYPAFRDRALVVDASDNIWIRTTAVDPLKKRAVVYDVVNNRGVLIKRVRVPEGRMVMGFARDGSLFLVVQGANGALVEHTRLAN